MLNSNHPTNESKLLVVTERQCADRLDLCSTDILATDDADLIVRRLGITDEPRALEFLHRRPLENVMMIGLICDYGIESRNHRGAFYGCFSQEKLISVALLGHYALLGESCANAAAAFARVAHAFHESEISVVLGEEAAVKAFRRALSESSRRLTAHPAAAQILLVLTNVNGGTGVVKNLRLALPDEAADIARMNADAHLELNDIDPAAHDPVGFRKRVLARILKKRIWVVRDEQGIAFKTDIVSVTEDVLYLEGVVTRSDVRGSGIGRAALSDLCRRLLHQHKAICLFADADSERTLAFYQRIGFATHNSYHLAYYTSIDD